MKTNLTENSPVGSRTTTKHGDGGREETENSLDRRQKSILIFNTPTRCYDCPLYTSIDDADEYGFCDDRNILKQKEAQEKIRFDAKPSWCPLSHPLKRVSNDFYIYDRKYLFDNLDREIDLLKGAKAFEEFMKAREEE